MIETPEKYQLPDEKEKLGRDEVVEALLTKEGIAYLKTGEEYRRIDTEPVDLEEYGKKAREIQFWSDVSGKPIDETIELMDDLRSKERNPETKKLIMPMEDTMRKMFIDEPLQRGETFETQQKTKEIIGNTLDRYKQVFEKLPDNIRGTKLAEIMEFLGNERRVLLYGPRCCASDDIGPNAVWWAGYKGTFHDKELAPEVKDGLRYLILEGLYAWMALGAKNFVAGYTPRKAREFASLLEKETGVSEGEACKELLNRLKETPDSIKKAKWYKDRDKYVADGHGAHKK